MSSHSNPFLQAGGQSTGGSLGELGVGPFGRSHASASSAVQMAALDP